MKKIMIVDDSLMVRLNLKRLFEKHGYEVVAEACDGRDAVDKFEKFQPDLITMDITMPIMDGISALREIMKIDGDARVIMISALGQESKIIEAVNSGAKHYIQKPINDLHAIKIIEGVMNSDEEELLNVCIAR